jgi:hypothetical protein
VSASKVTGYSSAQAILEASTRTALRLGRTGGYAKRQHGGGNEYQFVHRASLSYARQRGAD